VIRTEEGLKRGLRALEKLKKGEIIRDEKGLGFALETGNLLDVTEMILRACLMRKESRGPHLFFYHFDDPEPLPCQDPGWRKYIVIKNQEGKMVLKQKTPIRLEIEL
jgi:succinate dehydrogenase / fumarate reductase flavoprotein subunit